MRFHPRLIVATVAAALVFAVPVQAQDPASQVSFNGFGFSFDADLGSSVNITQSVGDAPDGGGPLAPRPPATIFSLYGRSRSPRAGGQLGEVRLHRVADFVGYDRATATVRELWMLLADHPSLDQTDDGSPTEIPYLVDVGAAQGIRAKAIYINTPEVSGVLFITAFIQDTFPFTSDSFTAVFQGVNLDGTMAVSASFPLQTELFPDEADPDDIDRAATRRGWERYVQQSLDTLGGGGSDAFSPPLTAIGRLIESMTFEDPPAVEASPVPSGG